MGKKGNKRASSDREANRIHSADDSDARIRAIAAAPRVSEYLDLLESAGCERTTILALLDWIACTDPKQYRTHLLRKDAQLQKLGEDLQKAVHEAAMFLIGGYTPASQIRERFSRYILPELAAECEAIEKFQDRVFDACEQTRALEDILFREAGQYYELYLVSEKVKARILEMLLRYIKESTGRYYDEWMADLLQAAHDTLGNKATFSAESLRKLRQRKMRATSGSKTFSRIHL